MSDFRSFYRIFIYKHGDKIFKKSRLSPVYQRIITSFISLYVFEALSLLVKVVLYIFVSPINIKYIKMLLLLF